jgi:hypothetical protein
MHRVDAYAMVRRRTAEVGFKGKLGCHVFRATGIAAYLELVVCRHLVTLAAFLLQPHPPALAVGEVVRHLLLPGESSCPEPAATGPAIGGLTFRYPPV